MFFTFLNVSVRKSGRLDITFEVAEGNSLIERETEALSKDLLNKTDTFYGLLHDTGVLNILCSYRFDGEKVYSRCYFLKDRIFENPSKSIWVKIEGKYSDTKYGIGIDANNFERLTELDEKIEHAKEFSCDMVAKNRMFYDLNNYKKTERFKTAFSAFQSVNLNLLPFRPDNSLAFIDFDKMIAGIDCGRVILFEDIQRGDYLTYYAIYDLKKQDLIKVIIINTGYFRE
jgi:hypothetical protein